MPPKGSSTGARGRGTSAAGRPSKQPQSAGSSSRNKSTSQAPRNTGSSKSHNDEDPFADDEPPPRKRQSQDMEIDEDGGEEEEDEDESETQKTIPPELLTRILHEFFEKDSTRISKDANAAVAKYMDIFVREAIARTAVEKESGFLEVEDLEKVAPQLLLDL
ncbi:CENP-S associating centromere protein X-domain-containing protein [Biscogniauxia mediterranea]|nr:CENP-S associating centromere protein X-domain-containing protein [Biscogniauxia mediterranea]